MEANLQDLAARLKRGASRAEPARRAYIPKGDGRQRRLEVPVLEDGTRTWSETGAPQGGRASPLLANIYLHYTFDLWVQRWRRPQAHGGVIVVRFADDFIVGFQDRVDAEKKRKGRFTVLRQTAPRRVRAKLSEVKAELRRRWHDPIPQVGTWLRMVVGGHIRSYGVPMNGWALFMFRWQVGWL